MSLCDGSGTVSMLSLDKLTLAVSQYKERHEGRAPKVLGLSEDDYLDFSVTHTLGVAKGSGLQVVVCSDLKAGECELAAGMKEDPCPSRQTR